MYTILFSGGHLNVYFFVINLSSTLLTFYSLAISTFYQRVLKSFAIIYPFVQYSNHVAYLCRFRASWYSAQVL